jgi:hypothetical protein
MVLRFNYWLSVCNLSWAFKKFIVGSWVIGWNLQEYSWNWNGFFGNAYSSISDSPVLIYHILDQSVIKIHHHRPLTYKKRQSNLTISTSTPPIYISDTPTKSFDTFKNKHCIPFPHQLYYVLQTFNQFAQSVDFSLPNLYVSLFFSPFFLHRNIFFME